MTSPMIRVSVWLLILLGTAFLLLWTQPWDGEEEAGQAPVAKRKAPVRFDAALAKRGRQLSQSQGCGSCHTTSGAKGVGPTWKAIYGTQAELTSGEAVKVGEKFLREAILDPATQVRKGFTPSMPSYKGKLSDADVATIVEYIKSLARIGH